MDDMVVATIIAEGGRLFSEFLRYRQSSKVKPLEVQWPVIPDELPGFSERGEGAGGGYALTASPVKAVEAPRVSPAPNPGPGEKVATSCVGCAIGHLATCSGLLKEAVRFTSEGMDSPNVIDRLNGCLDELNAMERVDLQPAKVVELPEWERELARQAMACSRETRHFIEAGIASGEQLEKLAASLTNTRQKIGTAWLQQKLRALSKEDKEEIQRRVMAKLDAIGEEK